MSILGIVLMAAVQVHSQPPASFPDHAVIGLRIDCEVRATRRNGDRVEPFGGGEYSFLLSGDRWPVVGESVPYLYTLEDGRTFFEQAAVGEFERIARQSTRVRLTTRSGGLIDLIGSRHGGSPRDVRFRGSSILTDGAGIVEQEGACRERASPAAIRED